MQVHPFFGAGHSAGGFGCGDHVFDQLGQGVGVWGAMKIGRVTETQVGDLLQAQEKIADVQRGDGVGN